MQRHIYMLTYKHKYIHRCTCLRSSSCQSKETSYICIDVCICMCMCVYVYTYLFMWDICVYIYIHTHTHIYTYIYIYIYIYIYAHTCNVCVFRSSQTLTETCMHTHTNKLSCMFACVPSPTARYVNMHTYITYIHTYIHTYLHTYIHTYIHVLQHAV